MAHSSPVLALLALLSLSSLNGAMAVDAQVIIIGAGISGIAAARRFAETFRWDVIVLEARSRPGGRLWTQNIQGTPVDMGGAWIQGTKGNPLTDLAKEFKLSTVPTIASEAAFTSSGPLPAAQVAEGEKLLTAFAAYLEEARSSGSLKLNSSVEGVLNKWLETVDLTDAQYYLLRQYLVSIMETEYAASIRTLSALYYDQDSSLGGDSVLWTKGYGALIAKLVEGIPIKYGHVVTSIDYTEENAVYVRTAKGQTYSANYVICTLPLGVLKSPKAPKFVPALPIRKRTAISTLGFGLLNKVILSFKTPFWHEAANKKDWLFYVSTNPGDYTTFLSLYRSLDKAVLVGFVAGDVAWGQENRTDAQIKAAVTKRLQAMFPKTYEAPTSILNTRWGQDPYARGSYPYMKAGAAENAFSVMAEPVDNKLFFAGDGTNQQYPATAHGAYWSGLREADFIINIGEERRRRERLRRAA